MTIALTFIFEDQLVKATRGNKKWNVEIFDEPTRDSVTLEMSDVEFASTMCVAISGDDIEDTWKIAEKLFEDIPDNLSLLP